MLKVTTPLVLLLAPFAVCFNEPVFTTFQVIVVAWIVCLGRRTISRVWQTTGQAADADHSRAGCRLCGALAQTAFSIIWQRAAS
jgi:hypothetical protein